MDFIRYFTRYFSSKNASSNDDGMIELKLDPHANKTEHVLKQDHQEEELD